MNGLEPTAGHRVQGEFGNGAEPVLAGAQSAQVVARLALERHHHIHQVLEQLGACDHPVLGDMADQNHRDAPGLGKVLKARGDLPNLAHRSRHRVHIIEDGGLDRVDNNQNGLHVFDLRHDRIARGLGKQEEIWVQAVDAPGAQRHLFGRLLSGHVDHGSVAVREGCRDLQQKSALADARFPGEQEQRSREPDRRRGPGRGLRSRWRGGRRGWRRPR